MDGYKVVITKSTVPVGTTGGEGWIEAGRRGRHEHRFSVASNPEFLREGAAIGDFAARPRRDQRRRRRAIAILRDLYRPLYQSRRPS